MINDGLIFYQVTEFMYLVEGRKQERGDNFQVCVHSRGVRKTEFLCCQSRTILILLFFSEKPIAGAFCSRHLIKRFPIHRVQLGRGMALMSRTFYSNLLGDEINRSVCWTGWSNHHMAASTWTMETGDLFFSPHGSTNGCLLRNLGRI